MPERLKQHFLEHQILWPCVFLLIWALLNIALLTTTVIMEYQREGRSIDYWQPLCWEVTSIVMILLCIWPIAYINRLLQSRFSLPAQLLGHAFGLILFSIIHVSGMVALRKLWYWLAGSHYNFGDFWYEFVYEFRKDAMSYITIVVVISGYQFMVRRLRGEASYIDKGEESNEQLADRLLVKKLGKEFLITTADVEWVEASGNYVNLHVGGRVYPMRSTMAKLAKQLPAQNFRRVHRSAIVNLNQVKHIEPTEFGDYVIALTNDQQVPLSRRYRDAFKSAFADKP
ncbi:LytTR family DNA-binding domain-containing protein [Gilvimarinus sp. SDUM040013]|uniref:LytTR family DNA-binding domain-containing protein n=1 Tax=Gilvimarinus gilvus TaxID=3058038 RepID=A0ABU4RVK8_9GAMM|nr:LytTR family DNA-binding domain-containing protein [Gilvimarinus sp. SDUM040013]MDO3387650.1 LytTR family DNA-binding domain-containing protein [Gilvimarinus sp. SDUM040013]MDX6848909.1 LytTR family DNA-binding domain-containing protein [Gilvimarinus sp. SDUM040013]